MPDGPLLGNGDVGVGSAPNQLLQHGGGGLENRSGFLAINEMLLRSHDGVMRLFPCWPREMDATFGTLRAVGAFLVSAELKNGLISSVSISSEHETRTELPQRDLHRPDPGAGWPVATWGPAAVFFIGR